MFFLTEKVVFFLLDLFILSSKNNMSKGHNSFKHLNLTFLSLLDCIVLYGLIK